MGTLGTFDSFTTARLGIYAAQHGLRVTGNNISNINTAGYTRQRVDQVSFKTGGNDRYASFLERHIGSGALVSGINQIRDPYLDIRYRNTSSSTAYYDTKLSGLQEIASILDEVGKGGSAADGTDGDGLLYAQLQDLMKQLRAYGASPTSDNNTLVRTAAETLTMMFRNYAGRLEQVRLDTEKDLKANVEGANEVLRYIRDLNKSIRDAELHGDKALELRDERNRQIDALSEYMHIKVEYTMEDVGAGIQVEKLTISLANDNPDPKVDTDTSVLVDGLYATQLSIPEEKPYLNPYIIPSADDIQNIPNVEALKGYLFLQEVDPNNLPDGYKNTDVVTIDWTNPDGTVVKIDVVGTNDPAAEGVLMRKNDNYTIQLGKLLDVRGEEWKSSKSTWTEVQGKEVLTNAKFEISVSGKNLKIGDEFKIKGKLFKVGDPPDGNVPFATVQDDGLFADLVMKELAASGDYGNYAITSDANGNIIFTANTQGKIDPADWPSLEIKDPDNTGWLTAGNMTCTDPGVKYEKPDNPQPPEGTETDPVTGNKVTTAYREVEGKWYRVTIETEHTREVVLDDNDLYGSLQAQREMLTEEGEFSTADDITIDENAKTKRGIPYYQKSFDLLAQQIAKSFNELNQGYMLNQKGNYVDKDGTELELAGKPVSKYEGLTTEQKDALIADDCVLKDENGNNILDDNGAPIPDLERWLDAKGAVKMGGPLFSNSNDGDETDGITASNIDIANGWSSGKWMVIPKFEVLFPDDENPDGSIEDTTQPKNINHMISLMDAKLVYDPRDIDPDAVGNNLFTGSFNDMFSNMMSVQAKDAKATNIALNNDYTTLVALDSSREGVSGVDLNDEAMNMMQYQKAMNAAMRLMTAIDEALDRLINNTGIAGR